MILTKRLLSVGLFKIAVLVPIFCVFLVTDIGLKNLLLSILLVFFALIVPGSLFIISKNFEITNSFEVVILGTTVAAAAALLVHPVLATLGIGKYTFVLFIIVGILFIVMRSKDLFRIVGINLNLKFNYLVSLVLIPFSIWIGRQANVVPIKNFDQVSVPPDIYHHLSIAAEIGNHGPSIYPYVAASGVSLQYHWGAFSLGSFLNAGGLIPLPIAMYRTEFIILSFLLLSLLFYVGKYVGKNNLSGVAASLLGALTLFPSYDISDGLRVPLIRTGSISQLAACVFLIAALRIFFQICESEKFSYLNSLTLTVLVMATTLSKGPTGLILIGIIGLTALIYILKRKFYFGSKLLIFPAVGFIAILPLIFTFGPTKSSGMSLWLSPLASVKTILGYYSEQVTYFNLAILTIVLVLSCVTPLFILILNIRSQPIYYLPIVISILVGIVGLLLLEAWGNSQWFVYYPVGPLIAIAVAIILPSIISTFSDLQLITFVLLGLVAQNSLLLLLRNWLDPSTLNLGALWVISSFFIFLITYLFSRIFWDFSFRKSLIAISVVSLFIGFFSAIDYKDPYPYPVNNYEHPWSITIGTDAATNYIRNNSSVADVIATNRHCVGPEESNSCISRIFTISALAERRTFIEGWAYTTCPVSEALSNSYWNQPLLKLNQDVVLNSEAKAAEVLSSYGVKWLLIDLRRPHAKDLSNIASKAFSSGEVEVWKLNDFETWINRPTTTGCLST